MRVPLLLPLLALPLTLLLAVAPAAAETVNVPFTTSSNGTTGGVLTAQSYSGVVTIAVSGTGWSLSQRLNDAFYVYTGGPPYYDAAWYHLRIGTGHVVDQLRGSPPPYTSTHNYSFAWNAGATPQRLRFWVSDGNFSDNGGSYTITVTPPNAPPTANAGGPYATDEMLPVTLDASGSADSDGSIVGWAWDCEDDGAVDATTPTVSCTYPDDGAFTARLTVTDDDGATAQTVTSVSVDNLDPTVLTLNSPQELEEGSLANFSATGSDPSPLDPLTASWSWGDGSPDSAGFTARMPSTTKAATRSS